MPKPRSGVLLVSTPPGWRPNGVHAMPVVIESSRWLARNLTIREAIAAARVWNKGHLHTEFRGEWALCVWCCRRRAKGTKGGSK